MTRRSKNILNVVFSSETENIFVFFLAITLSWTILGASPFLRLGGMWSQVETQILFLHFIGAVLFLYKSIRCLFDRNQLKIFLNPLVFIPMLIAIFSFLLGSLQRIPILAWFGSAQVGQGAFWYLDLAIFTALFIPMMQIKTFRLLILINLLLMTSLVTFFTIFPGWNGIPITFYYFNDYLCFYGILSLIVYSSVIKSKASVYLAFLILGIYLMFLDNRAAQIIWIFVLLVLTFYIIIISLCKISDLKYIGLLKIFKSLFFSKEFFTILPIVFSIIILLSSVVYWQGVGPIPTEVVNSPLGSLVVRGKIIEVALMGILNFKSFFVGNGWGSTSELLLANMNIFQFDQLIIGYNLHFHTHNDLFEHLVSLGITGFVLGIAYMFFIYKYAFLNSAYSAIFWLLYFSVACFWFLWSGTLPLIAIAASSIVSYNHSYANSKIYLKYYKILDNLIIRKLVISGLFLSSLALIYGSWIGFDTIQKYKKLNYSFLLESINEDNGEINCLDNISDTEKGGMMLAPFISSYSEFLSSLVKNNSTYNKEDMEVLQKLECMADDIIKSGKASVALINLSLLLPFKFITNDEAKEHFMTSEYYEKWKARAFELIKVAPKREDILVPFIAESLKRNEFKTVIKVCSKLKKDKINAYCDLSRAYILLDKNSISRENINEAAFLIESAVKGGVLDAKNYGWWSSDEIVNKIKNYNMLGIPLSPDILFLVNQEDTAQIIKFLESQRN